MADPSSSSEDSGNYPPTPTPRFRKPNTHGNNSRLHQDRERFAKLPPAALIKLLIESEYESENTRNLLNETLADLEKTRRRLADSEAERRTLMATQVAFDERLLIAQRVLELKQEAVRSQSELEMYKRQLEASQNDLRRAEEILRQLERERNEADEEAAQVRSLARQLGQEKVVENARRDGYEEGIRNARIVEERRLMEEETERRAIQREERKPHRMRRIEGREDEPENQARRVNDLPAASTQPRASSAASNTREVTRRSPTPSRPTVIQEPVQVRRANSVASASSTNQIPIERRRSLQPSQQPSVPPRTYTPTPIASGSGAGRVQSRQQQAQAPPFPNSNSSHEPASGRASSPSASTIRRQGRDGVPPPQPDNSTRSDQHHYFPMPRPPPTPTPPPPTPPPKFIPPPRMPVPDPNLPMPRPEPTPAPEPTQTPAPIPIPPPLRVQTEPTRPQSQSQRGRASPSSLSSGVTLMTGSVSNFPLLSFSKEPRPLASGSGFGNSGPLADILEDDASHRAQSVTPGAGLDRRGSVRSATAHTPGGSTWNNSDRSSRDVEEWRRRTNADTNIGIPGITLNDGAQDLRLDSPQYRSRSELQNRQRNSMSGNSDSTVGITIEPPSPTSNGNQSQDPSRPNSAVTPGFLSPNDRPRSVQPPSRSMSTSNGNQEPPVIPTLSDIPPASPLIVLPDNQLPAGFVPLSVQENLTPSRSSTPNISRSQGIPVPFPGTTVPRITSQNGPTMAMPIPTSRVQIPYQRPSSVSSQSSARSITTVQTPTSIDSDGPPNQPRSPYIYPQSPYVARPMSGMSRPRSSMSNEPPVVPAQTYAPAPTPSGVTYPAPHNATPGPSTYMLPSRNPSAGSRTPHQRSQSLDPRMTPASASHALPNSAAAAAPRKSALRKNRSNSTASSAPSIPAINPSHYVTPPFGDDSLEIDPLTHLNTRLNSGRPDVGMPGPAGMSMPPQNYPYARSNSGGMPTPRMGVVPGLSMPSPGHPYGLSTGSMPTPGMGMGPLPNTGYSYPVPGSGGIPTPGTGVGPLPSPGHRYGYSADMANPAMMPRPSSMYGPSPAHSYRPMP